MQIIIEFLAYFVLNIIIAIFGFYTGEIIIFIVSFGKKKIRWNFYRDLTDSSIFIIVTELSIWIGFIFWMCVINILT